MNIWAGLYLTWKISLAPKDDSSWISNRKKMQRCKQPLPSLIEAIIMRQRKGSLIYHIHKHIKYLLLLLAEAHAQLKKLGFKLFYSFFSLILWLFPPLLPKERLPKSLLWNPVKSISGGQFPKNRLLSFWPIQHQWQQPTFVFCSTKQTDNRPSPSTEISRQKELRKAACSTVTIFSRNREELVNNRRWKLHWKGCFTWTWTGCRQFYRSKRTTWSGPKLSSSIHYGGAWVG